MMEGSLEGEIPEQEGEFYDTKPLRTGRRLRQVNGTWNPGPADKQEPRGRVRLSKGASGKLWH